MNILSNRTRRGAAILFSGVLVLGGLALTGDATASENVDGNPTCEGLGYAYSEKWDGEPSAGTYALDRDGMVASLTVGTHPDKAEPNQNNAIVDLSISMTDYAIIVKGGSGATVYGPDDSLPLHAPVGESGKWPAISHFQLCWNETAPQPEVGKLEVTKVVVGTDTPDDHTFTICVTPVAGGDQDCKDVEGEATVTWNLLPGEYLVTETAPGPRFSVEGSGVTVTVEPDKTATATVTNTWTSPSATFGRVEVTKVVTGEDAPTDGVYEICLTGPDPSTTKECKTLVGEETVMFGDLVPGQYTVTETEPGAEYAGPEYTATITDATVEVTIGEVATATVTNEYTQQESLPPTTPATPEAPAAPVTPAAPTEVLAQTALPATGSESGIAAIATILIATGAALTLLGRRRGTQQA